MVTLSNSASLILASNNSFSCWFKLKKRQILLRLVIGEERTPTPKNIFSFLLPEIVETLYSLHFNRRQETQKSALQDSSTVTSFLLILTFWKLSWNSSFCFFKELVFIIYYKKQTEAINCTYQVTTDCYKVKHAHNHLPLIIVTRVTNRKSGCFTLFFNSASSSSNIFCLSCA